MLKPIISGDAARLARQIAGLEIALEDKGLTEKDRAIFENTLAEMKQRKSEIEGGGKNEYRTMEG